MQKQINVFTGGIQMKKLINGVDNVVDEMLRGMAAAHPQYVERVEGTDVMINLVDPGWCRTELGGPNAPNSPESALPGVLVGAFLTDKKSGRILRAQDYAGLTLEEAVASIK